MRQISTKQTHCVYEAKILFCTYFGAAIIAFPPLRGQESLKFELCHLLQAASHGILRPQITLKCISQTSNKLVPCVDVMLSCARFIFKSFDTPFPPSPRPTAPNGGARQAPGPKNHGQILDQAPVEQAIEHQIRLQGCQGFGMKLLPQEMVGWRDEAPGGPGRCLRSSSSGGVR